MKVVIDIPENDYWLACNYPDALISIYAHYIKKGIPLPKKHGRLVDMNALKEALIHAGQASGRYRVGDTWELNFEEILDVLVESPTIVEAEGEK